MPAFSPVTKLSGTLTAPLTGLTAFTAALSLVILLGGCQINPVLRQEGIEAFGAGNLQRADNRFAKAVRQDPTDWKSLYYLGRVRVLQGRPLDGQLLLEKSLALHSDHFDTADILDALAESIYQQGPSATGRLHQMLKSAADERGTSRDFLRQGRYLMAIGDIDSAKVSLRKSAHFAGDHEPEPFLALADFYELIGDREAALIALRQAYSIAPRDDDIRERLRRRGLIPGPTLALPRPVSD